jgi:hypothetical protein
LGRRFSTAEFERAFESFHKMYGAWPERVLCSPDVLERYSELYARAGEAHRRELRFGHMPISAAVMPPGTVAFEGHVDPDRMGDW